MKTIVLLASLLALNALATDSPVKEEMRFKLLYAQGILEGITTENFPLILTNAVKMKTFSRRSVWDVRDAPEYRRLTVDFQRNLDSVTRAATQRNVDSATVAYFQLTTSCVTCHKYLRGAEVSGLNPAPASGLAGVENPPYFKGKKG
jgi:hypothetical protein